MVAVHCSHQSDFYLARAITLVYWHETPKTTRINHKFCTITYQDRKLVKKKMGGDPCTGTEALYRPYGLQWE